MNKFEYEKPVLTTADFGKFVSGASLPGENENSGTGGIEPPGE